MKLHRFCLLLPCSIVLLVSMAATQSSSANAELNLGVQAYKDAKGAEAIDHFRNAVALDGENIRARLYLATAYAQQYIPGVDTTDNNDVGERAIEQYRKVIDLAPPEDDSINPARVTAVKGVAYLYLQMKRFDDAKDNYRKVIEFDPQDPEPYYSIAVIDWTETYQPRQEGRMKLGLKTDASLSAKNPNVCDMLRVKNWDKIQEGIDNLNKTLELRPDYDDAMAYLNLMYRERADVQCGDPAARKADLQTADEWVDRTMAFKKAKAEKEESLRSTPEK